MIYDSIPYYSASGRYFIKVERIHPSRIFGYTDNSLPDFYYCVKIKNNARSRVSVSDGTSSKILAIVRNKLEEILVTLTHDESSTSEFTLDLTPLIIIAKVLYAGDKRLIDRLVSILERYRCDSDYPLPTDLYIVFKKKYLAVYPPDRDCFPNLPMYFAISPSSEPSIRLIVGSVESEQEYDEYWDLPVTVKLPTLSFEENMMITVFIELFLHEIIYDEISAIQMLKDVKDELLQHIEFEERQQLEVARLLAETSSFTRGRYFRVS